LTVDSGQLTAKKREEFYHEGTKVTKGKDRAMRDKHECQQCGGCCRSMILEIYHLDILREPRLAEHAILFRDQEGVLLLDRQYMIPSPCPMLVDNKCSIYATRPAMCVVFGHGESAVGMSDIDRCREIRERSGI
jgi:Fe-S-cluster containining protein